MESESFVKRLLLDEWQEQGSLTRIRVTDRSFIQQQKSRERERGGGGEGERQREREIERQTDRQTDRQTVRQTDREGVGVGGPRSLRKE